MNRYAHAIDLIKNVLYPIFPKDIIDRILINYVGFKMKFIRTIEDPSLNLATDSSIICINNNVYVLADRRKNEYIIRIESIEKLCYPNNVENFEHDINEEFPREKAISVVNILTGEITNLNFESDRIIPYHIFKKTNMPFVCHKDETKGVFLGGKFNGDAKIVSTDMPFSLSYSKAFAKIDYMSASECGKFLYSINKMNRRHAICVYCLCGDPECIDHKKRKNHRNPDMSTIDSEIKNIAEMKIPVKTIPTGEKCRLMMSIKNNLFVITNKSVHCFDQVTLNKISTMEYGHYIISACLNTKNVFILHTTEDTNFKVDVYDLHNFNGSIIKKDFVDSIDIKISNKFKHMVFIHHMSADDSHLIISDGEQNLILFEL
jgi:hypothetical protein